MFDICKINYYLNKNVFTGSKGQFNFRIANEDDSLQVAVWYGVFCYQKSEIVTRNTFEVTQEGLDACELWLQEEYSKYLTALS